MARRSSRGCGKVRSFLCFPLFHAQGKIRSAMLATLALVHCSINISCLDSISTESNKRSGLLWEQRAGGSNPLAARSCPIAPSTLLRAQPAFHPSKVVVWLHVFPGGNLGTDRMFTSVWRSNGCGGRILGLIERRCPLQSGDRRRMAGDGRMGWAMGRPQLEGVPRRRGDRSGENRCAAVYPHWPPAGE